MASSACCPHSGAHLAAKETGTSLAERVSTLRGGHPLPLVPASHLGSTLIPVPEGWRSPTPVPPSPKGGCTPAAPPGEACVITGLLLSQSGGAGAPVPQSPIPLQPTSGNCPTQSQAKRRAHPSSPVPTPPGRWAPVQLASRSGAAPSATPRPRSCRAGRKRAAAQEPTCVLSPPGDSPARGQPLPAPLAPSLPEPVAVPAQDPRPTRPRPLP